MKHNELETGEIYYCEWPGSLKYILRKAEGNENSKHLEITGKNYAEKGCFYTTDSDYRPATERERNHFLQCEAAGKYVAYKKPKYTAEIFN